MAVPSRVAPAHADASLAVRRSYYQQHLVAARYFADAALAAEHAFIAGAGRAGIRQRRDLVAASVLSVAAWLEVSVNELQLELQEGALTNGRRHSARLLARLAREWRANARAATLAKYQMLLQLYDCDAFHPRRSPYVEVDRLMRWRDVLAARAGRAVLRLEPDVLAQGVAPGVPPAAPEPHVGRLRLDAACARWAVDVAEAFSTEFCRRMRLPGRPGERAP